MPSSAHPQEPEPPEGSSGQPDSADEEATAADIGGADGGQDIDWAALPAGVRDRIVQLAAAALGKLPAADIPRQLRPVARFAPRKRAKLGATAIFGALRESTAFRTAVLEWLREHRQDALDPNATDSVAAAAAAVLLNEAEAAARVRLVAKNARETNLRAQRDAATARAQRLEAERDQLRAEVAEAREAVRQASHDRDAELDRLRSRLREQGGTLRRARDEAERAAAETERISTNAEQRVAAVTEQLDRERQRSQSERGRADGAVADARSAQQSAREARQADEVRLGLLVDTLEGAAAGLRRELSLRDEGPRPADTVRNTRQPSGRGQRVRDVAALERVLALPRVHLIVDGYNVTKTGYPDLVLADQRDRLTRQLAALSARTGAETTVVFDGAGVVAVPTAAPREVRVLFSDPDTPADDVIIELVEAEPAGRPAIVATSDRAVADGVRAAGVHVVSSAVVLARLGNG